MVYINIKGYLLTCLCENEYNNLKKDHYYVILDFIEWKDEDLIKIHYPCGNLDFSGKYKSDDKIWSDEFKTFVKLDPLTA